jgi:hypothetical protein
VVSKKTALKAGGIIVGAVLITIAWGWTSLTWKERINQNTWSLVFFTHADNGLSHDPHTTRFKTLPECKDFAEKQLARGVMIACAEKAGDCKADGFHCGRGCTVDAPFGSVMIDEYKCIESFKK